MPHKRINRLALFILASAMCVVFMGTGGEEAQSRSSVQIGGSCEDCELMYAGMPEDLRWETTLADVSEPGERLEISGTIFRSDGTTPARDVILYVYHTDARGYYSPSADQTDGRRHGHLRGWMKTNEEGRYKFRTVKPAAYPTRTEAAHIHPIVKEPDKNEYYIDDFLFDDDPLLSPSKRRRLENRGGSGVLTLRRDSRGVWIGERNIVLGRNIPGYASGSAK
ncbi:MAG TPA: intradiol ring-cleavage dioxygenase [Bacteroidota bacterium]|nr:intradiol ring-cleavage dioxygenase [Bacteroidota bacterium]